ncbi:hypothetical protein [Flavobacterium sp.]|uniref:tetratricopeptide repeat protein n=1 Tax=Flavobacterium sp. TaxID=239 RepID=UPI002B4B7698|nr:hypothetical protein [Flavobacterium sp.]HLP63886.1 hypothetical protein [Flavobacterium sp.]
MKTVLYTIVLFFSFSLNIQSQNFIRKTFNYNQIEKEITLCDEKTVSELENSVNFIKMNNSDAAVASSKKIVVANPDCYEAHNVYAMSLFRNGKLIEGINTIDEAIEKFGSVPELIKSRVEMSLELYQVGVGQRNVDGNSIFTSGANQLPYDDEHFKEENLKSALLDLEYLTTKFPERYEDVFILAKIQQIQGNFKLSTTNFERLTSIDEYRDNSLFNIAENYIQDKNYSEGEKRLLALSSMYPKEPNLLGKLQELYKTIGNEVKEKEYQKKVLFYEMAINSFDFDYNEKNFENIVFFSSGENSSSEKFTRLKEIKNTENENYVIDICLSILKMHANHGNGLEDEATDILEKIGKPSLEKTHQLLQTNISTCTMSNLAQIMSTIKDESSWELLVNFLGYMTSMPSTLIPPNVPEKIIKFDEERGTKEVLKVIKQLLSEEDTNSNSMFSFGNFIFYSPLKKMNQQKIITYAKEIGFTEEELKKLKKKIKD